MFRDYENAPTAVKQLYCKQRSTQCPCFVHALHAKYLPSSPDAARVIIMSVWDALLALDNFVDVSDPDTTFPNSQHAIQTAEGLRAAGAPDWMQLCGLLHDLGKVLFMKGESADGTDMKTQFSVVGDTYPVNLPFSDKLIFPHFGPPNCKCYIDLPECEANCGFSNLTFSFGHDEYFYQVLKHNSARRRLTLSTVPWEFLYIIRFHSFHAWHEENAYADYADMEDDLALPKLQQFSQFDLYTKHDEPVTIADYKPYYDNLMLKYFGCSIDAGLEW